ncbi:DUF6443 domain-containing protein [Arcticibacter tournemirensis]
MTKKILVKLRAALFSAFVTCLVFECYSQDSDRNFVGSWIPRKEVKNIEDITSLENYPYQVGVTISYVDDLSRTEQIVMKGASPSGVDVIQMMAYDVMGRQSKVYLPYVQDEHSGAYNYNPLSFLLAFYNQPGSSIAVSEYPYSETLYDNSPLNRVIEQGSAGSSWQMIGSNAPNSGHTVKTRYETNNQISAYEDINSGRLVYRHIVAFINGQRSFQTRGTYASGDLFVQVRQGENWKSGDGRIGTTEEYKDKSGKLILKRSFNRNRDSQIQVLSTYYVYDDFGNLCYILPPNSNPDNDDRGEGVDNWFYCFNYDAKHRMIARKYPGKAWEYFVYNSRDQLVASQDGNQRKKNEWTYLKYDFQGRLIQKGYWTNNNRPIDPASLSLSVRSVQLYEYRTNNGYSSQAWPTVNGWLTLENYYDSYDFPSIRSLSFKANSAFSSVVSENVKGLQTGSWHSMDANLGDEWIEANFYDERGRCIQQNRRLGDLATDIYDTEYDFLSQVIKSQRTHYYNGSTIPLVITSRYEYDHMGRRLRTFEKVGDTPEIVLAQLEYNELGQIIDKKLHKSSGSNRFIQSIDYRYTIKGWLSSMNSSDLAQNNKNVDDNSTSDSDKFGMELLYDGANIPQYNGFIGGFRMKAGTPSGYQGSPQINYDFIYDPSGRLLDAVSSTGTIKDKYLDEFVTYDEGGNIINLGRWAKIGGQRTQIDSLVYQYGNLNSVTKISDLSGRKDFGFLDLANDQIEYEYDNNGNIIKDSNKGIVSITYNRLNLPEKIMWSNGNVLSLTYDGEGKKISKNFWNGSVDRTTYYLDGIQYEQGQLSFITTEEGRVHKVGQEYIYKYDICDYAGNVRVTVQPSPSNSANAQIVQINNYYPYGYQIISDDPNFMVSYVSGERSDYLFSGKEFLGENGLNQYDYGARFYDPVIGRFNSIDPLSEQRAWVSPFNYGQNNPINRNDPTGALDDWIMDENMKPHWYANVTIANDRDLKKGDTYLGESAEYTATNGRDVQLNSDGTWNYKITQPSNDVPYSQSVDAFTDAIRENMLGLKMAEGIALGTAAFASGEVAGGEAAGNFLIAQAGRKSEFLSRLAEYIAAKTGMTDLQLVTRAAQKAETAIGGTGRFAGTAKHTYANNLLSRYQSIYGNSGLQFNQYFNGPAGRGFLDVVNHRTMTIYDYKFGSAVMGNSQFLKYSNSFPGYGIQIIRP